MHAGSNSRSLISILLILCSQPRAATLDAIDMKSLIQAKESTGFRQVAYIPMSSTDVGSLRVLESFRHWSVICDLMCLHTTYLCIGCVVISYAPCVTQEFKGREV